MPENGILHLAAISRETVWFDANRYNDAERQYQELRAQGRLSGSQSTQKANNPSRNSVKSQNVASDSSIVSGIRQAREKIQNILKAGDIESDYTQQLWNRVQALETEKANLSQRLSTLECQMEDMFQKLLRMDKTASSSDDKLQFFDLESDTLKNCIQASDSALDHSFSSVPDFKISLEKKGYSPVTIKTIEEEKKKAILRIVKVIDGTLANICQLGGENKEKKIDSSAGGQVNNGPTENDDVDLFGSDEETEEEIRIREERLKAYANKKSKKPALVAKSSVLFDVKPWDDETNMQEMEAEVKKITMDGLVWGASKLVPLAYGIKKLQIVAVVEDEKVSIDALQELIEAIEDKVQSVDIAAFNKL